MHHQVGVGDGFMNFSDSADGQHFTGWLAGELVSTVTGADGDGQSINFSFGDEVCSLSRVGEQLIFGELTLETMAVISFTLAGLYRA